MKAIIYLAGTLGAFCLACLVVGFVVACLPERMIDRIQGRLWK